MTSVAVAILLFLAGPRARALDSNRTLTQALHRIWQIQQGLPDATVSCIRQTQDGYLWLGTQTGLVRFDGMRFATQDRIDGVDLTNLWVRDFLEDSDHALWIATDGAGLIRLHNGGITRYSTADGLPSNNVYHLLLDSHDVLWICTADGLASFSQGRFTVYRTAGGLASNDVRCACLDKSGALWVGGGGQPAVWNGSGFTVHLLSSLPPFATLHAMLGSSDGSVWFATTAGLIRRKDGVETLFTTAQGLADDEVFSLTEGRDGCLWVGTKDGFARFRNGEFENFRAADGLSQSTVYALCEDREGGLWVGTKHGLNQFLDRRTIPFTQSEGLSSNDTGPVLQDRNGNIWVGTSDGGLDRFDGRRFSVLTTRQGLASDRVLALANDPQGNLWIGTDHGLNRLHDGRVDLTVSAKEGLPADAVRCLWSDPQGNLWVGTAGGLAVLRDGRTWPLAGLEKLRTPIVALSGDGGGEGRDGGVFIATGGGGLYRWADGKLTELLSDAAGGRSIDAFYQDADPGAPGLWLGTLGDGLRLWDGTRWHQFSMRDGLFDDDIYGIVADDQDRLWIACSKGIFFISRSELRQFAAGKVRRLTDRPFSPTDAQRTIECKAGVQPSAWRMRDGTVWFSTIHGALVIDPARFLRDTSTPAARIEEVIVNGQSQDPARIGPLPPGSNNLEFRYTCLSFLSPTRLTFRYQLEGFDKDWIDAGIRREAFYTNLPPGRYRFRVEARNLDGPASGPPGICAVTLSPYFYQRAWFGPVCVAALAAAGWLAVQLRIRRVKHHLRAILAERSRIARELHDTLIQGFSGVTMQMQALAARLGVSPQRTELEEIIRDAGASLREARRSVAGLRSPQGSQTTLAAAIAQAARQITEANDVRLKLDLNPSPRGLRTDVEYNLLRIAQEAISNSVKHAGARTIEVGLDCRGRTVRLAVSDDGAGFDEREIRAALPGHYGLVGMKERASQIGAEFDLHSEPGKGTTVLVQVPAADGENDSDDREPGK